MAPCEGGQHISLWPARFILRHKLDSLQESLIGPPGLEPPVSERICKSVPEKFPRRNEVLYGLHQRIPFLHVDKTG